MRVEGVYKLSRQRGELCPFTRCCLLAPSPLSCALPCELELDVINSAPLPAGTTAGCVNKGHERDTARHSTGGGFSSRFLCDLPPSGCGCQSMCETQRHSPSSVLLAPQRGDSCGPASVCSVCQRPGRWLPAHQHQPLAPLRTPLEPQQMASCGPVPAAAPQQTRRPEAAVTRSPGKSLRPGALFQDSKL